MKGFVKRTIDYIFHGLKPRVVNANIVVSASGSNLKGRRIIVTGGGRGLGFYIAKKCIEEGAKVVISGRSEESLKKSSVELSNCAYVVYDVTSIENRADFFDECEKLLGGPIHCLVNNAGISLHEGSIYKVTSDTFDKQFDTNLKAPYFLSQEYIRRYEQAGLEGGSILFITSERGLYCDDIPYGLIKAAINSLTQGLGRRLLKKGIRVNAVAPGVTASDMTGRSKEGNLDRPASCGGRVFLPEEVAEVSAFLLSDKAKCINSQIIPCNQGNHLRCDW